MGKYRKKRNSGGGGNSTGPWGGVILTVFGAIALLVALIMFGIGIGQLDTAITNAASYTEMTSLDDIMGIFGLVIFLAFMVLGLGGIGGGAYVNLRQRMGGSWMDLIMLAIMGGVSIVIALIMNNIILTQLHAAYTIAACTTNVADFVGLLDIMGIFGMVIFISLIASAVVQIGGAGFGAYKKVKGY